MLRISLLLLFLTACQATNERFEWGQETYAPLGWTVMCREDPEAFSCAK